MAPDTDTNTTRDAVKDRWLRIKIPQAELPEFNHLFDFYWGGPERRITGLTLRIIAVNAIALVMLLFGILYLGQYQNNIIESKLDNFETTMQLITHALSESAIDDEGNFSKSRAEALLGRFSVTTGEDIKVFDATGQEVLSSAAVDLSSYAQFSPEPEVAQKEYSSIRILKDMTGFIIGLLPDSRALPRYPVIPVGHVPDAFDYPNAVDAIQGTSSLSAWQNDDGEIMLTAASPLRKDGQVFGVVLLTHDNRGIEDSIAALWSDILTIFFCTLLITIMLSIYLSGAIASPLKRLAKAAEGVRTGRSKGSDIPDFSHRHDEIGDLSVALGAMMNALWERMDSIESFAADVAHELKNPLTSLRSAIETADKVTKKADKVKLMQIIQHDLARMDRLISDISNSSRLDAELSREAFVRVDLAVLFAHLLELYKRPLKHPQGNFNAGEIVAEGNVTIALSVAERQGFLVMGLQDRLGQVFHNLIDNALSFAPKGSRVEVCVERTGNDIQIFVRDEGVGIPENKLTTIFERFYSERPENEGYGQHSGLGLSICKQIIDAHNGDIFARNITDEAGDISGAEFSVILKSAI